MKNNINIHSESDYNLERSFNPSQSDDILHSYLKEKGFSFNLKVSDKTMEVSQVFLYDEEGRFISEGSGKGKNHEMGSFAESIEHFVSEEAYCTIHESKPLADIIQQDIFKRDYFLQSLKNQSENPIAVVLFYSFQGDKKYSIPVKYVDSKSPYILSATDKHIGRFYSNTGISLGLDRNDCLLHGLNENIERHYYSMLCQELIGIKTSINWMVYKNDSNDSYTKKRNLIEKTFGPVVTVVAQTEFDSFVSLSFLKNENEYQSFIMEPGGGSSFYFELAIQRGIDELAQCAFFKKFYEKEKQTSNDFFATLKPYKGLHPLIDPYLSIHKTITKHYSGEFEIKRKQISVEEQAQLLVKKLIKTENPPLYRNLASENGVSVIHTFIPSFDKFFLIRRGSMIAPLVKYKKGMGQ